MQWQHDTSTGQPVWCQWSADAGADPAGLQLWHIDLDRCGSEPDLLDAAERERATRFKQAQHQRQFIAGRTALRRILSRLSGLSPQRLAFRLTETGKPLLVEPADLHFNLSHSGAHALVAASTYPVGVDIESVRERPNLLDIARRVLDPAQVERIARCDDPEQQAVRFTREWVRFEASQKMTGTGLFGSRDHPPHQVEVFEVESGWLGAFALASPLPLPVRYWRYPDEMARHAP